MLITTIKLRYYCNYFNPLVWLILLGTLLIRTGYFMVWPFLIIYLKEHYAFSSIHIGILLAGTSLFSIIFGVFAGHLSDCYGRKVIIISGCLLSSIVFLLLANANNGILFIVCFLMTGLMRPLIEEPSKAAISDTIIDIKTKESALYFRYFIINVGGALGALIGTYYAVANFHSLFSILSLMFVLFAVLIKVIYPELNSTQCSPNIVPKIKSGKLKNTILVAIRNKSFFNLITVNFLMMLIYSHLSSTIPQIIIGDKLLDHSYMLGMLVVINTLTIIVFQFPIQAIFKNIKLRMTLGSVFILLSQLLFTFTYISSELFWFAGAFILSMGELFIYPCASVIVDKLAPSGSKGVYFGLSTIPILGYSIAPFIGGIAIQYYDPDYLFMLNMVISLIMIYIMNKSFFPNGN